MEHSQSTRFNYVTWSDFKKLLFFLYRLSLETSMKLSTKVLEIAFVPFRAINSTYHPSYYYSRPRSLYFSLTTWTKNFCDSPMFNFPFIFTRYIYFVLCIFSCCTSDIELSKLLKRKSVCVFFSNSKMLNTCEAYIVIIISLL